MDAKKNIRKEMNTRIHFDKWRHALILILVTFKTRLKLSS